ncbi:MAG: hypothetical protein AMXMBFR58_37740 [Phycisphaerae bacterium]
MLRNLTLVVQLFAIGPLVAGAITLLRAADGGNAVTPLLSESPLMGALAGLLVVAGACVIGLVDARFFGARSGLAGAGVVLGWAALYSGRTEDLLRLYPAGWVSAAMMIEGLVASAAVIWSVQRMARAASAGTASGTDRTAWRTLVSQTSILAVVAGVVAGGVVAYFVAFYGSKGQTLFAGSMAGIAAGAAAAVVSAGSDGSKPVADPVFSAAVAMALLAVIGPATIVGLHSDPLGSALAGTLRPLGHLNAFDWTGGALMGIPIGLGWAGAHAQAHTVTTPTATAAS